MRSIRTAARHLNPVRIGLAVLLLGGALLHTRAGAADSEEFTIDYPEALGNESGYTVSTQDPDPPGRVGRLSEVLGQVWLYDPEQREWVTAERNRPLTSGDRLSTDALARAELRVGSTVVRLDSNSELEVLRLDDDHLQLQLHRGGSVIRLRDSELAAQFEMVTAEGRFRTDRAGGYRFDRTSNNTQATVISGQLSYEGHHQALTIDSGQRVEFLFNANGRAQYAIVGPKRDAFAAWNAERDRNERDGLASQRHVSPEMTGAEDLDRHGRWDQDPEYGAVWIPRDVGPGWAPYTTGRWSWVQPWGWTWVDAAPWGFAPFHYGRWVQRRSVWCWAPGRYVARPAYAPALVGWVGGRPPVRQPGVDVAISIGRGGWFPLSPHDRYVPGYRANPRHDRDWNGSHRPYFDSPRERGDRGRDRGDRYDRGVRRDRDERGERPSVTLPHPHVNRGLPNQATALPPQVFGTIPGVAPMLPNRPRPDDRSGSRWPRNDAPNAAPGMPMPGVPQGVPAPRPNVRPAPLPQALPVPAVRPTPGVAVPNNAELMRNPQTRNQWLDSFREQHQRQQAPAMRAEPVQPSIQRDTGRNPQRGADAGDVRRERPTMPGGGDQRVDPREGRDRRHAN